jgi:hypothetical protein
VGELDDEFKPPAQHQERFTAMAADFERTDWDSFTAGEADPRA